MVLTTSNERGYLRATANGTFALSAANRLFLTLLEAVAQAHAERVLLDGRGVTGVPRAMERYLYGAFVAAATARLPEGDGHAPKFAYVLTYPVMHPGKLGENTARRRGMNVKTFDNEDDALKWLFSAQA